MATTYPRLAPREVTARIKAAVLLGKHHSATDLEQTAQAAAARHRKRYEAIDRNEQEAVNSRRMPTALDGWRKSMICMHESGHAVVSCFLDGMHVLGVCGTQSLGRKSQTCIRADEPTTQADRLSHLAFHCAGLAAADCSAQDYQAYSADGCDVTAACEQIRGLLISQRKDMALVVRIHDEIGRGCVDEIADALHAKVFADPTVSKALAAVRSRLERDGQLTGAEVLQTVLATLPAGTTGIAAIDQVARLKEVERVQTLILGTVKAALGLA